MLVQKFHGFLQHKNLANLRPTPILPSLSSVHILPHISSLRISSGKKEANPSLSCRRDCQEAGTDLWASSVGLRVQGHDTIIVYSLTRQCADWLIFLLREAYRVRGCPYDVDYHVSCVAWEGDFGLADDTSRTPVSVRVIVLSGDLATGDHGNRVRWTHWICLSGLQSIVGYSTA